MPQIQGEHKSALVKFNRDINNIEVDINIFNVLVLTFNNICI